MYELTSAKTANDIKSKNQWQTSTTMWAWFKTCLILFTTWFTRLPTTPTLLFYSGESVLFCVHGKVSDCCSNYYFLLGKMSTLAILSNGKLRAETVSWFLDDGFNSDVSSIPLLKCSNLDCLCNMSLHVMKIQTSTPFALQQVFLFTMCSDNRFRFFSLGKTVYPCQSLRWQVSCRNSFFVSGWWF